MSEADAGTTRWIAGALVCVAMLGGCGDDAAKEDASGTIETRVPESCLVAIEAMEDYLDAFVEVAEVAGEYSDLIYDAYDAGINQNVQRARLVLDDWKDATAAIKRVRQDVDAINRRSEGAAKECRDAAATPPE